MHAHARRKLLYVEVPEEVFEGVPEGHLGIGSVDPEHGWVVRWGENPLVSFRARLEILDTDPVGINSNGLWERFGEGCEELLQFLGFVLEEILPEIFDEALVDLGCVFFHLTYNYIYI